MNSYWYLQLKCITQATIVSLHMPVKGASVSRKQMAFHFYGAQQRQTILKNCHIFGGVYVSVKRSRLLF